VTSRQVVETDLHQGVNESIAYTITTTPWGSSPSAVVVTAYDITTGDFVDVSATVLSGVASVIGDVITLPKLQSLTARRRYRVDVKFTCSGNTFEPYFIVQGEL
jgi:hypothetical protein